MLWSVVAANGRVLGRADAPAVDERVALMAFLALCPALRDPQVTFGRRTGSRSWHWQIGDSESGFVAVSGQTYERHATALSAFDRFVAAALLVCADEQPRHQRPGDEQLGDEQLGDEQPGDQQAGDQQP